MHGSGNILGRRKNRKKASRDKKKKTVSSVFSSLNDLSSTIPKMFSATKQTEKSMIEAEASLKALGEEQLPAAISAAPYIGGALAIGSMILLKNIVKEF
jgi:hypothetical protein